MILSQQKYNYLAKVSDSNGVISALAFDQRGALKCLMAQYQMKEPTVAQMEELKVLVSEELTPYASSILLDPEYGLPAAQARDREAGLLLAYEKTGYDANTTSRLPDCLVDWSIKLLTLLNSCSIMMLMEIHKLMCKNKLTLSVLALNVKLKIFRFSLKFSLTTKQSQIIQVLNLLK